MHLQDLNSSRGRKMKNHMERKNRTKQFGPLSGLTFLSFHFPKRKTRFFVPLWILVGASFSLLYSYAMPLIHSCCQLYPESISALLQWIDFFKQKYCAFTTRSWREPVRKLGQKGVAGIFHTTGTEGWTSAFSVLLFSLLNNHRMGFRCIVPSFNPYALW